MYGIVFAAAREEEASFFLSLPLRSPLMLNAQGREEEEEEDMAVLVDGFADDDDHSISADGGGG